MVRWYRSVIFGIKYVAQLKGVHIQHARNGGEKRIDQYRVDGYYETKDGEKVVMEYHGCFWHGCPKCYTKQTINTVNGNTGFKWINTLITYI
jgi:G:T-mismatch repair DNA endonuclease (very short patch repair protein)